MVRAIVLTLGISAFNPGSQADTIPAIGPPRSATAALRPAVSEGSPVALFALPARWSARTPASDTVGPGRGASPLPRADLWLAEKARTPRVQESARIGRTAAALSHLALPGTLVMAGALYAVGRTGDRSEIGDLGLHTGQAIVAAEVVTAAGKLIVGRARPSASPADPGDVGFGRGLRSDAFQSFPSAHTAAAFAAATVIRADLSERRSSGAVWVNGVLYGGATLMGTSRIYREKHWASDVIAGAVVGTLAGWRTIEYHDSRRVR